MMGNRKTLFWASEAWNGVAQIPRKMMEASHLARKGEPHIAVNTYTLCFMFLSPHTASFTKLPPDNPVPISRLSLHKSWLRPPIRDTSAEEYVHRTRLNCKSVCVSEREAHLTM